jgi:hypothetical protein
MEVEMNEKLVKMAMIEEEVRELLSAGLEREAERRLEAWAEAAIAWAEETGESLESLELSLA